ncbi:hypothetical protein FDI24_gp186 [Acidovorax phage ACP17]|uniref:Uncharacterized protein n=1 Tax=Acidovorax phage ACP17 TaxID=2010329 RepID=A0A218M354_9CAUD|nr:hypothetical protein FDI24_gp186 [Acidovorax phage ACP17]ASD50468.1 hypothetical protein [Acidovorax phage ACP17]
MTTRAAKHDLYIEQGATFDFQLNWKQGKPAVPVDLTGCSARMKFREEYTSPSLFEASTDDGNITLGVAAGTGANIRVLIPAAVTAAFTFDAAIYDLEIVAADGVTVRRLLQGRVIVNPEVTHDD